MNEKEINQIQEFCWYFHSYYGVSIRLEVNQDEINIYNASYDWPALGTVMKVFDKHNISYIDEYPANNHRVIVKTKDLLLYINYLILIDNWKDDFHKFTK